ncbi:Mitogen-activated protein kinase kinase kinase 2 [Diplonema papillatum]|nr:Mitogen-activated protein kinase kinase kinase 2 [Diplonema papillatum]
MDSFDVGKVRIIDQCLGKGAFGTVFMGLHEDTGQQVAVKEIRFPSSPHNHASAAKQLETAAAEIALMKSVRHPNIVQYLGALREGFVLLIFMEYIPGGTLTSLVRNLGALTVKLSRKIMKDVMTGLTCLHLSSICHRDVKCDNVLLTSQGEAKLADFGASKHIQACYSQCSGLNSVCGTPWFMAPEILSGESYGLPVDIWAAGGVLYEMLTGKHPYSEFTNACAALYFIANKENASLSLPPQREATDGPPEEGYEEARHFVSVCFEKNPRLRPSADQLLEEHTFLCTTDDGRGEETPTAGQSRGGVADRRPVKPAAQRPATQRTTEESEDGVVLFVDSYRSHGQQGTSAEGDDDEDEDETDEEDGGSQVDVFYARESGRRFFIDNSINNTEDDVPTRLNRAEAGPPQASLLPYCQLCHSALAVFMCTECQGHPHHNGTRFCPRCWDTQHHRLRVQHIKSPVLFTDPGYIIAPARGSSADASGVVTGNGQLVEMLCAADVGRMRGHGDSVRVHSGLCSLDNVGVCRQCRPSHDLWFCGRCTYGNCQTLAACEMCEGQR